MMTKYLLGISALSLLWFNILFLYIDPSPMPIYADTLVVLALFTWRHRARFAEGLRPLPLSPFQKYLLLSYGMVLLEEVLAAFVNNLKEGFSPMLFLERIEQFWLFNIIAFSGYILGIFFLRHHRMLGNTGMFALVSVIGIVAERIILLLSTNPIAFLTFAPVTALIYIIIFAPAILSLPNTPTRTLHPLLRALISVVIIFCFTIPFAALNGAWRNAAPELFPPCAMIHCDD